MLNVKNRSGKLIDVSFIIKFFVNITLFLFFQNGDSALHEAALKGHTEIIRLLIKGGINLDLKNEVSG